MRCGAGPLVVMAAVFWTQCVLLHGVDARKERKKPKEAAPQQTETLNATMSNSEEVGGSIKVEASWVLTRKGRTVQHGSGDPPRVR